MPVVTAEQCIQLTLSTEESLEQGCQPVNDGQRPTITSAILQALALPSLGGQPELGAWLFLIAPKGRDLFTQTLGALQITAGECNRKGEFQLFQLVFTLLASVTGS
jgi:hypothetical protein